MCVEDLYVMPSSPCRFFIRETPCQAIGCSSIDLRMQHVLLCLPAIRYASNASKTSSVSSYSTNEIYRYPFIDNHSIFSNSIQHVTIVYSSLLYIHPFLFFQSSDHENIHFVLPLLLAIPNLSTAASNSSNRSLSNAGNRY